MPPLVVPPTPNAPNVPATVPTIPEILLIPSVIGLNPGRAPPKESARPPTLSASPAMPPAADPTTLTPM